MICHTLSGARSIAALWVVINMRFLILLIIFVPSLSFSEIDYSQHIKTTTEKHNLRIKSVLGNSTDKTIGYKDNINKIEERLNSESYKDQKALYTNKLSSSFDIDTSSSTPPKKSKSLLPEGHSVLLYLSSSMPIDVIHRYAIDLHKVNGTILLRGTIGGISKMIPTTKFINEISKVDRRCVDSETNRCDRLNIAIRIDPKRFSENNITRVPALTFEKNYSGDFYCNTGQPQKNNHVVYGDSSLQGMLSTLYDLSNDPALNLPITILQGLHIKD